MNDSELGLELAEIVRKEQEEATMLHREQKDVAKHQGISQAGEEEVDIYP